MFKFMVGNYKVYSLFEFDFLVMVVYFMFNFELLYKIWYGKVYLWCGIVKIEG